MSLVKKTVTKALEVILFDIVSPTACIAVKGVEGLREITSRRKEEHERQKAASKKEEKK